MALSVAADCATIELGPCVADDNERMAQAENVRGAELKTPVQKRLEQERCSENLQTLLCVRERCFGPCAVTKNQRRKSAA